MVIRKNPMYDTSTPPGQFSPAKRLGDIIDAVRSRSSEPPEAFKTYQQGVEHGQAMGYARGWADGMKEGWDSAIEASKKA